MTSWQQVLQKWRKSHFIRFGLPLLTMVVGSSFLTLDFQRIKYEARAAKSGNRIIERYGQVKTVDFEEEAEIAAEMAKDFQWRNIRGPRPYEDNTEFLSLRESHAKIVQEATERAEKAVEEKKLKEN